MSEYRVEKQEVPVVLFLSDGLVLEGVAFLSPFASTHSGRQTLIDLLREKENFFPFRKNDGTFTLVNKSAVTHVRYDADIEEIPPLGEEIEVGISFFGGEILQGRILLDFPKGKNRLLDYVNGSPGFFSLKGEEADYVANGSLVREIAPLP